jgi:hypothetical protein
VVGDDEATADGGDVLDAAHLHPEPRAVQRPQHGQVEVLGEVLVEPELVDGVVARDPSSQERQHRREVPFQVLGRDARGLSGDAHGRDARCEQLLDARRDGRRGGRRHHGLVGHSR